MNVEIENTISKTSAIKKVMVANHDLRGNTLEDSCFLLELHNKEETHIMDNPTQENQLRKTYLAFYGEPKTMLMVAEEIDIMRANVCRYVARLREGDNIAVVKNDRCSITGHYADYLTTDPDLFPEDNQYFLFDESSQR